MNPSILINPKTKAALEDMAVSSSHALLLSGPAGSGKAFVARYLAARKLGVSDLQNYPYLRAFQPAENSLGIDRIRDLQKFLQLKTLGDRAIRRIAIIEDAHLMTNEAQNALLKSLEEPPADTAIILTAPFGKQLKDTIYSRVQRLEILPVDKKQALEHFGNQFDVADIERKYLMTGGLAGLLYALLNDQEHPLAEAVQMAKQIMTSASFDRLARVDELAKQKAQLPIFLQACRLIASTAMSRAVQKGDRPAQKRWHHTLTQVHKSQAALAHNPNPKLLLTNLFLQM